MKRNVNSFMVALLLMIGVVLVLPLNYSVWCGHNTVLSITNPGSGEDIKIKELCNTINEKLHDKNLFMRNVGGSNTYTDFVEYSKTDDTVNIAFNMTEYKEFTQEQKTDTMNIVLSTIIGGKVSQTNRVKIYNFVSSQDTVISNLVKQLSDDVSADFVGAYSWFRPIAKVISVILGLFTMIVFALLAITICFDLAFLTIPVVNLFLSAKGKDGRPALVSLEADKAYKEALSINNSSKINLLGAYFSMKSKMLIAMSICVLYLVRGEIFNLVGSFMDLFMGFVK